MCLFQKQVKKSKSQYLFLSNLNHITSKISKVKTNLMLKSAMIIMTERSYKGYWGSSGAPGIVFHDLGSGVWSCYKKTLFMI